MPLRLIPLLCAFTVAGCAGMASRTGAPQAASGDVEVIDVPAIKQPDQESAAWWYRAGAARAAANGAMAGRAKNVIVFLGDGMSLSTVAAARILQGQRAGGSGEEHQLSFETLPYTALAKTYNTDFQTPDSAGTMTAIATGAKTRFGVIGIGQAAGRGDCAASRSNALLSILDLAESAGMATGVVTTTRVTHATPAAVYAHSPDRNWESDADVPQKARTAGCTDIAAQMLETQFGDGIEVVLGGGRGQFTPTSVEDAESPDKVGLRLDGRDLTAEWRARNPQGAYVWNSAQLAAAAQAPRLLGLFGDSHMRYEADRAQDKGGEPSLAELTRAALRVLQKDTDGYFLLVEGGRIDHAHHEGNAARALTDTIAFSDAVRVALEATSADDTLLLVTADHAHTMSFAGYPLRGNAILGKVRGISGEGNTDGGFARDANGLPYTTLGYANGPGALTDEGRRDLNSVDTENIDYLQASAVPLGAETHGGEDVGVWARGPGAAAVRGTLEQNVLYHLMVQSTSALRARLCKAGTCNAGGVPVELPQPDAFLDPASGK